MRRGIAAVATRLTALLLATIVVPGWALAALDDLFVPENIVYTRLSLLVEEQDRALDQSGRSGPLKNYLIRDLTLREEIVGTITRSVTRYDLRATYGISNSWNLSLNIPFVEVEQTSTLSGIAGASTEALEFVDRLQSQTIKGIGDVELASLHRPIFTDWNAFTWGYGLAYPGSGQKTPYVGSTTLQLGEPMTQMFGFIHYTRYPAAPRSRFDFRVFVRHKFGSDVTTANEEAGRVDPTNAMSFKLDWNQEIGNFMYGLSGEVLGQGEHTVNGVRLVDQVRAQILRTRIGYGNFSVLEEKPQAFSYQIQLEFRNVLRGANIPNSDHVTLSIQTYF